MGGIRYTYGQHPFVLGLELYTKNCRDKQNITSITAMVWGGAAASLRFEGSVVLDMLKPINDDVEPGSVVLE